MTPTVYTIPPSRSFVDSLAAGLLRRSGGSPERLAETIVLVPTRRAVRSLSDAFLRQTGGQPTVLPRLSPIGDVAEDELLLEPEPVTLGSEAALDLPPAIDELRRQLLLGRLIDAEQRGLRRSGAGRASRTMTAEQAARLAAELARLLDQVHVERLSFDGLEDLVPDDYAAHWQVVLRFLHLLTRHWPAILEERGLIDAADRRNRLLAAQAAAWQGSPPAVPVIAAGSTGSVPATADLLEVVANLPTGAVVLPGLDRRLDDAAWRALPPTHPQYGLARLLGHLGIGRDEVGDWPEADGAGAPAEREELISLAMRPAAADAHRAPGLDAAAATRAVDKVSRIDCATAEEEAGVVAILMREALQTGSTTAALVTPDRGLARRVAAELRRWGVEVDDSAGAPLSLTPAGAFLRLTARMAAADLAPVDLLAALKHPLAAGGRAPAAFRAEVRRLESAVLRGPRPAPGFAGLRRALGDAKHRELREWLAPVADAAGALMKTVARKRVPLAELLTAHVAFAEWLAGSDEESGAARLWAGDGGEAAAQFVAELDEAADGYLALPGREYPGLLDALMAARVVRPRYGRHPRLAIWGPLEARLQHVDRLIIGGLNEGTWPREVRVDPWMSRPMRAAFGLPPLDRQTGLAAHDFAQAFCAPEVFLTRAERVDGTPTVESRWLARLDVALNRMKGQPDRIRESPHRDWWRRIDRPAAYRAIGRPTPRPPVSARPRSLSVTEVETWLRDPYSIYARHVLKLAPIDPLDADPGAADRGTVIHRALERFVRDYPDALPDDALGRLIQAGEACFRELMDRPGVRAFWWPRFERIAHWFIAQESAQRSELTESRSEVRGAIDLAAGSGPFRLRATADRIDRFADGRLAIVDYKTGAVPAPKEMRAGLAPQLPLEAAIAASGGFEGIPAGVPAALAFWRLTGGTPAGEVLDFAVDPGVAMEEAREGLIALIDRFDDFDTAYLAVPRSGAAPRYNDYGHLARILEWSAGPGEGEP